MAHSMPAAMSHADTQRRLDCLATGGDPLQALLALILVPVVPVIIHHARKRLNMGTQPFLDVG
jgi:hypothetical protein